jgi:serine/threonine protein kinase
VSQAPDRLGPYEIRSEIGSGGMGVVYLGWDPQLNRKVAVKTLRPELARDAAARNLFLREARAIAAISHPNVTQIYFIGEQDNTVFFAMEYLEGKSLQQLLQDEGKVSADLAVNLVRQAAEGLKAAADRGIVHRDIKPSNLVLGADSKLKVTDFGLAKQTLFDPNTDASTILIGTADYLSPERASGQGSDLRSDIYSLGATAYELVTGRPPFRGATTIAVIMQHVRERVPEPRRFCPDLPYPLSALILRMLAKQPETRPQDYDALLKQLDRLPSLIDSAASQAAAASTTPVPELGELHARPRQRSWVGITLAVALISLVGLGAWNHLSREEQPEPSVDAEAKPTEPTAPDYRPPTQNGTAPESLAARPDLMSAAPPQSSATARANLTILQQQHEFTAEGDLHITGTVSNTGERRAAGARIRVIAVDATGKEVASTEALLAPNVIGPGEVSSFDAVLPGARGGDSIKLELFWLS